MRRLKRRALITKLIQERLNLPHTASVDYLKQTTKGSYYNRRAYIRELWRVEKEKEIILCDVDLLIYSLDHKPMKLLNIVQTHKAPIYKEGLQDNKSKIKHKLYLPKRANIERVRTITEDNIGNKLEMWSVYFHGEKRLYSVEFIDGNVERVRIWSIADIILWEEEHNCF